LDEKVCCLKFMLLGVLAITSLAGPPPTPCQVLPNHPYNRLEIGFRRLLKDRAWVKWEEKDIKHEVRVLWRGSGRRYNIASLAAAVGVMECHWSLPPKDRYEGWNGKNYEKVRGHLGCHCGTLLSEVRRRHVGGIPTMWLSYWKRDPFNADFFGASRLGFIILSQGSEELGLCQWVGRDDWKTNPKENKRAKRYAKDALWYRAQYF